MSTGLLTLFLFLCAACIWGDSIFFGYASDTWKNGQIIWSNFAKALIGGTVGMAAYLFLVRYLEGQAAIIQTAIWITCLFIVLAVWKGEHSQWFWWQKLLAINAVVSIIFFVVTTTNQNA